MGDRLRLVTIYGRGPAGFVLLSDIEPQNDSVLCHF